MAKTNQVKLLKSGTANATPGTGDLDYGEVAINYVDDRLFYKKASNTIKYLGEDTYSPLGHNHSIGNLNGFNAAHSNEFLRKDGTWVVPYTHPTGDGNLHVPATGTTNNGKVLTAGSTAGSLSWVTPTSYSIMGSGNSYASGLVPAGSATHGDTYLRKDGTWGTPVDTNTWRPLGTGASDACAGNDPRLSDARTPTAHTHSGEYAPVSHTHSYLPLAGGTLTGSLTGTSAEFNANSASDPDSTTRARYPSAHAFTYTSHDNGVAILGGEGGFDGSSLMIGEETARSTAFNFIECVSDTNGTVGTEFRVDGVGNTYQSGNLTIDKDNAKLILKDTGTGNAINSWVSYQDSTGAEKAYIGYGSSGNSIFYMYNSLGDLRFYAGGTHEATLSSSSLTLNGSLTGTSATFSGGVTIQAYPALTLKSTDGLNSWLFYPHTNDIMYLNEPSGNSCMYIQQGAGEKSIYMNSNGVGIKGDPSSGNALTVSGNAKFSGNIRTSTNGYASDLRGHHGGLEVRTTKANSDCGILGTESGGGFRYQLYGKSGYYGFLNGAWSGWDIKKAPSGAFEVDEGSGLQRVLNAGNYSTYALPRTGGGLTGTLTITKDSGAYSKTGYNADHQLALKTGTTDEDYAGIRFSNTSGNREAFLGVVSKSTNGATYDMVYQVYTQLGGSYHESVRIAGADDSVTLSGNLGIGIGGSTIPKPLTIGGGGNGVTQEATDNIVLRNVTTGEGAPSVGQGLAWTWSSTVGSQYEDEEWAAIRVIMPGNGNTHMTFSTTSGSGETNLTERMRITDTGLVGMGVNPSFPLHVKKSGSTYNTVLRAETNGYYMDMYPHPSWAHILTNCQQYYMDKNLQVNGTIYIYHNGAYMNNTAIYTAGEGRFGSDVIAYYSDERLKSIEGNIQDPLKKISMLNGFYYRENETARKLGYDNPNLQVGLSAQEVKMVMPEVIQSSPINENNGTDYMTINYAKLTPLLIEAIKELKNELNKLKQEMN